MTFLPWLSWILFPSVFFALLHVGEAIAAQEGARYEGICTKRSDNSLNL
jgi:hypothetical protein